MLFSSASCPSCISSCATFQVIPSGSRVAAPGDGRVDKRPRRDSHVRWGKWVIALSVLCLSLLGGFAPSAEAQTAHFSWAVPTLGSGFNSGGVAVDGSGNVFVADTGNSAVKEILAASGYTTVNTLGSGFSFPSGVAVDGSGNVFVADTGNNAVKEILAAGGYTTVNTLGSGFSCPSGVAVDGSGNVFVADSGNNAVKEILTQGVNFGSAAIGTITPLTIPLTFTFDTAGTLTAPAVLTQGPAGLDFADAGTGDTCAAGTYAAGDTCTLNVSFTPQFSGIRFGAATLSNSSGAV